MGDDKTGAIIARCSGNIDYFGCGYAWIAAFLPMPVETAARLISNAACPMCGDGNPVLGDMADLHPALQEHLSAFAPLREAQNG